MKTAKMLQGLVLPQGLDLQGADAGRIDVYDLSAEASSPAESFATNSFGGVAEDFLGDLGLVRSDEKPVVRERLHKDV